MILKRIEHYETMIGRYERVLRGTIEKCETALQGLRVHCEPNTIDPKIAYGKLPALKHRVRLLIFVHVCLSKCLRYNVEVRQLNSIPRKCFHNAAYFESYYRELDALRDAKRRRQSK